MAATLTSRPSPAQGQALSVQVAPEVSEAFTCDGQRLRQILSNVLSNACKFTLQGSVAASVESTDGQLRFHVRDPGPGIAADKQALVFEKFRQGDARVSYEHGGTGLGLALSRGLAELMGDTLTMASTPGQDACFTLAVPQGEVPEPA